MTQPTSRNLTRLAMLFLAILLIAAGLISSQRGFQTIQNVRQIERIPQTSIVAALNGEIKISAQVARFDRWLSSEHFKVKCVYYRYRYEEQRTDSDGNKYWDTQYETNDQINFLLQDDSGQLVVLIKNVSLNELDISIPISQQQVVGARRYTEWRIEPKDTLFLLGRLRQTAGKAEVYFPQSEAYLSLISKYGESEEKSDLGLLIVLMVSGGISLLAFAAFCLSYAFGIHRILAFLFILSFSTIIPLLHLGVSMLYDDTVLAQKRLEKFSTSALAAINQTVQNDIDSPLNWTNIISGLQQIDGSTDYYKDKKINDILINLAFAQQQYAGQLSVFPNNVIAWFYSINSENISAQLNPQQKSILEQRLKQFKPAKTLGILPNIFSLVGLFLCFGLSYLGFRLIRLKRHIENIPTSKSTGLVFGLSELKGRISKIADQSPLISPLTQSRCYWYRYLVREKRGSGDSARWVTIEDRQDFQSFYCKDAFGKIKISPFNAEIISKHKKTRNKRDRRYQEQTLKLSDKIYILGQAKIDRITGDQLEIRGKENDRPFLISNLSEQELMLRKANKGMLSLTAAFSILIFSSLFYLGSAGSFSPLDYLIAASIAPIYMSLLVLLLHYNDLIFLKQRANRNLSNIHVAMRKRYDLIPNLQKIVKGFLSYESTLLTQLAELRKLSQAPYNEVRSISGQEQKHQVLLGKLIVKLEDYPKLKSASLSVKLINKLIDLENEIALMREGYNDTTNYYNTRIATIPDVFFARLFNFKSLPLFKIEAKKFSRVDPKNLS